MARKRKGRPVNGILLLDKPVGISSNNALQKVRWIYNAAKAGHTGALDPLASGMLPLCFGEATKFSQFLLNSDKGYRVTAKLGETTTTADAEGDTLQVRPVNVTEFELTKVIEQFIGETEQIPSMYSALKHNGQPLYKLARQGIEVERAPRVIRIDSIELESFSENQFSLYVECSKGTYIRNLVEDIGEALGCGAHVTVLRREWVAHFKAEQMVTLEHLVALKEQQAYQALDDLLLPVDESLVDYPKIELEPETALYFSQGQAVTVGAIPEVEGVFRVYREDGVFLGVAEFNDDLQLAPKRLMANLE
jgi:tRNA pseudouridine55 synthase